MGLKTKYSDVLWFEEALFLESANPWPGISLNWLSSNMFRITVTELFSSNTEPNNDTEMSKIGLVALFLCPDAIDIFSGRNSVYYISNELKTKIQIYLSTIDSFIE